MKIQEIDYKICCDVPGCGNVADYSISFSGNNVKCFLCKICANKLKKELLGLETKKNAK